MNLMNPESFKITRLAIIRDKKKYAVRFDCQGDAFLNIDFELTMTKDDTVEIVRDKIIEKVKDMIISKNRETELQSIVGNNISLNGIQEQKK